MADSPKPAPPPHNEGIVFGMPDHAYHADPSLGSTGLKQLMRSAADYWWTSWMNEEREQDPETPHMRYGSAFHTLVLEGESAFLSRYAIAPDMDSATGILRTADDLRAYLRECGLPATGNKAVLLDRVRRQWQSRSSAPCPIWHNILDAATDGGRKTLIPAREFRSLQRAARMLAANPILAALSDNGAPQAAREDVMPRFSEVSVFWRERVRIGSGDTVEMPCKARFDSLGLKSIIDLKTMANPKGAALSLAIPQHIHAMGYDLQAAHYMIARERALRLVADGKVFAADDVLPPEPWLNAFARIRPLRRCEDPAATLAWSWFWIFIQTTGAPIAEFRMTRFDSELMIKARVERELLLRRCAEQVARHGTEMWMHATPVVELSAQDMPKWRRFQDGVL